MGKFIHSALAASTDKQDKPAAAHWASKTIEDWMARGSASETKDIKAEEKPVELIAESAVKLLSAVANDQTELRLTFDKPLDSISAQAIGNYSITESLQVLTISQVTPGSINSVSVSNVKDLYGESLDPLYTASLFAGI